VRQGSAGGNSAVWFKRKKNRMGKMKSSEKGCWEGRREVREGVEEGSMGGGFEKKG